MFSILFMKGQSGGFGDRLVGILTVLDFAKLFNEDFEIIWDIDISTIFKDRNMKYQKELKVRGDNYVNMFNIGNNNKWKKILETFEDNPFPFPDDKVVYFRSNMTTSQYIYNNKKFENENYLENMRSLYKKMYNEIFIPTEEFKFNVEKILRGKNIDIGIQVRTGDYIFYENQNNNIDKYNPLKDENIEMVLKKVRDNIGDLDKHVYITSDNSIVIDKAKIIFKNLSYNKNSIIHIDISNDRTLDNITNMFIDHYILSTRCDKLYISDYSNFGKTIGLCSKSNEVYNLRCEEINKEELLYDKKKFKL